MLVVQYLKISDHSNIGLTQNDITGLGIELPFRQQRGASRLSRAAPSRLDTEKSLVGFESGKTTQCIVNIVYTTSALSMIESLFEPQHEKTNNVNSDQVWHKSGCTATGDG